MDSTPVRQRAIFQPHDLVRIDPLGLHVDGEVPAWVQSALCRYPWVVVRRRASHCGEQIPVGVRGVLRSQRFAMQLDETAVMECLPPSALVLLIDERLRNSPLPVLSALPGLSTLLADWRWGPGGSVAFHLATGAACVNAASDLDILIYPSLPVSQGEAAALLQRIRSIVNNADVLIEMPEGAYALAEYADGKATLLRRTIRGPVLGQHPKPDTGRATQLEDDILHPEAG